VGGGRQELVVFITDKEIFSKSGKSNRWCGGTTCILGIESDDGGFGGRMEQTSSPHSLLAGRLGGGPHVVPLSFFFSCRANDEVRSCEKTLWSEYDAVFKKEGRARFGELERFGSPDSCSGAHAEQSFQILSLSSSLHNDFTQALCRLSSRTQ